MLYVVFSSQYAICEMEILNGIYHRDCYEELKWICIYIMYLFIFVHVIYMYIDIILFFMCVGGKSLNLSRFGGQHITLCHTVKGSVILNKFEI